MSYFIFPGLLIRFYRSRSVRRTFKEKDATSYYIEQVPLPILVLSFLYLFYVIVLHILILFNGMFPVFGVFYFGRQGIVLLDISIICLMFITWGTLKRQHWAWWASVIMLGMFALSTTVTFIKNNYLSILMGLAFPSREMQFLKGLPLQGYHFSILVGIPLLVTWIIAISSKRYFSGAPPSSCN
jgi:hypothetical protein